MLTEKIENCYHNRKTWIDPYDSETINNRYIRALIRRVTLFFPELSYKTKIIKTHFWPENLVLLGTAALNKNNKELVDKITTELINFNNRQLYWGLPIDWHSGKYLFPKNTLMSTTTAETILFLYDVNEVYGNIEKETLIEAAYNLYNHLNKNYINETHYFLSYTPMDSYKVYNSNLLVAAALSMVGNRFKEASLIKRSEDILEVCLKNLPTKGFIPYHFEGVEDTSDSYHQLFSIRALWYLKKVFPKANELYELTLNYFWEYFYEAETGTIKLRPNKKVWDLQPYAEALRVLGLINDYKGYEILMKSIGIFTNKNNEVIQRVWPIGKNLVKSNVCYSRQGLFRLYTGLSYRKRDKEDVY